MGPERWKKWEKRVGFGAYRNQKAGFSYMYCQGSKSTECHVRILHALVYPAVYCCMAPKFSQKCNLKFPNVPCRPVQILQHTVSPRTCLKYIGQVRRGNHQVPLSMRIYMSPPPLNCQDYHFQKTSLIWIIPLQPYFDLWADQRNTLLWDQWSLRYGQPSPRDLVQERTGKSGSQIA